MLIRHWLCFVVLGMAACSDDDRSSSGSGQSGPGGSGGGTPPAPVCGNSIPEEGEECDDGGVSSQCDADCTLATCGDGVVNRLAAELCDDGNSSSDDPCDACTAKPFDLDSGGWNALWPDVTVTHDEEFLVAYKRGNAMDVVARTFDAHGTPSSQDKLISAGETAGPLSVVASPRGGALVAWQFTDSSYGGIRYRVLDAALEPLPGVQEWSIMEGGRDPHIAAGTGGGYCVAGFIKSLPVMINCIDAQGTKVGGTSFPDTFGGLYYEGSHDIIPVGDGYVFTYVPDDQTNDIVGYPLTSQGEGDGNPFEPTAFVDAFYSWVPKWGGRAGEAGFVALAGLRQMQGHNELLYRVYTGVGQPAGDLLPATSTPDTTVREGLVLLHSSGRFAIVWTGDVVVEQGTGYLLDCAVKARLFAADGKPEGDDITLDAPKGEGCATGVRGAVNQAGDVFLTWMYAVNGDTMAVKQALLLPSLLGG